MSGASIQFDYTAFNQPSKLTNPNVMTSFKYDPSRSRMVQRVLSTGGGTKTYTYVDLSGTGQALYEQEATASSVIHKHFIFAPTGRVAEVDIQTTSSGNDETTKYFLKDHLGSIDLARVYDGHIAGLDSSTNKIKDEYLSYDAFGQRRAASTWANSLTLVSAYSDRGFTDHEHLEDFGLIHMNGRIYDPLLGRFLSADPNIQSPKNTQSLNRFSYVMNNPLSATDPTGYFSFSKFMHKWMPIILQIGMMAASGGLTAWGQAAVAGFMGFSMSGGDPRAGLIAAATAGMFSAVGTAFGNSTALTSSLGGAGSAGYHMAKILAHGIVGGVSAKMGGGNFADGFRSAGATQAFAPMIGDPAAAQGNIVERARQITVAAIVGGTASAAAGGGKFANGAMTGAFSRAFNDLVHSGLIEEPEFASTKLKRDWYGRVAADAITLQRKYAAMPLDEWKGSYLELAGKDLSSYELQNMRDSQLGSLEQIKWEAIAESLGQGAIMGLDAAAKHMAKSVLPSQARMAVTAAEHAGDFYKNLTTSESPVMFTCNSTRCRASAE